MQDHLGNYSTGQANSDQQIRAVDSGINFLKRTLGFPQDEKKYTFYYAQDNLYYNCPSDFQEAIALFYDQPLSNFPNAGSRWDYRPWTELSVRSGLYPGSGNIWSHTTINGQHQLFLLGSNKTQGQLLESFDKNVWVATGDANSAKNDTNIFYEGTASESFTLTYSIGTATLTSPAVFWDFTTLINKSGNLNLYVYFTSTAVTNVQVQYMTDNSNYYAITATQNANGQSWQNNAWNKLTFATPNASVVGSPNKASITKFKIIFTIPNTFGTAANFRLDDFYYTIPDLMDFVYYSNLKGTDTTGAINRPILTALSDILPYDWDFVELAALRAAIYIWPQLKGDPSWMQIYHSDFMILLKTYARTWPRKRLENNFNRTRISR